MERNDNYYGVKAKLAQVIFHLFSGNPLQLYQEGTIDVSSVFADYMGLVTDPTNPVSRELNVFPELSVFYIAFNASAPPFDDVNVRQAFSYAVDKEKVIKLATKDVVSAAYGILPPGMPGYNSSLVGLKIDPVKAKSLIAASKYGSVSRLPPLVLNVSGWGGNISGMLGGIIEEWRHNLGVEVTVRQLEPEAFLYAIKQEKNELIDSGWIADYPDPQDFLDVLFRTGSQSNSGSYGNSQLDRLLDKASGEQDQNTRLFVYQEAEKMIVEDAAVLPLFFGRNYALVKPYVKDYTISPLGFPLLSKVSIQR
jgi:oligopeptide transport system substrate-binding protein